MPTQKPVRIEADVKQRIRALLDAWAPAAYYEMWVPSGYGKRGLDFNCVVRGHALYIEAKAPGKYPTIQQRQSLVHAHLAGAACFVISSDEGIEALKLWLLRLLDNTHYPH